MKNQNSDSRLKQYTASEKRKSPKRQNKLWITLGVLILILIMIYWIFFIAIDMGPNQ